MSSVWITSIDSKAEPLKMIGNLSPTEARRYMRTKVREFVIAPAAPGKEPQIKTAPAETVLLFHGDELIGSLHIEHLSPPTKAGAGDNWIKREAH